MGEAGGGYSYPDSAEDDYCDDRPDGKQWPVRYLLYGHKGPHESADFIWSNGQQARLKG